MPYPDSASPVSSSWGGGAPKLTYLNADNNLSGATLDDPNTQAALLSQEKPTPVRPPVKWYTPTGNSPLLMIACILLHVLLVFFHLLCLGVGITRIEHRVVIPLGQRSNFISTLLVQVLQIFTTLYTAAIVFLTQQLAICRNLLVKQKLAATHDKVGAWNGLGSAVLAVWRQISLTTSVGGTIAIAVYLGGVAVLHITTPTLLALTTFNVTEYVPVGKQFPTPDFNQIVNLFNDQTWQDQSQALPFLERIDGISKVGVYNGTLYEVLDTNNGVGNVTVNAMTFNITCGHLINSQTQPAPDEIYSTSNLNISTKLAPNMLKSLPEQIAMSRFFVSTTNITDSNGDTGPLYTLKPPIKPSRGKVITTQAEVDASTIYTLQTIACVAGIINSTVTVDAQSKLILTPPEEKTKSEWWAWHPTSDPSGPQPAFMGRWRELFSRSAPSLYPAFACDNIGTSTLGCIMLSTTDQFLAQNLHLYPDVDPSIRSEPYPNITLHQLENSLASLSAMAYWATTNIGRSGLTHSGPPSYIGKNWTQATEINPVRAGTVPVKYMRLSARLNVNLPAVIIGMSVSSILLLVSIALIRNPGGATPAVDAIGVLQLLWLSNAHPEVTSPISRIGVPTVDDLRRAGMFEARLDGRGSTTGAGW